MIKISPSLLAADFANFEKEIKAIEDAGADMIHIDVMDGHFVPNLTFGPSLIKAIRHHTKLPFDVHLMIEQPEKFLKDYVEAGADIITIHPESTIHLHKTIQQINSFGIKSGIALLPSTAPEILNYLINDINLILVMSVNPGFGGQKFISAQLAKISILADKIKAAKKAEIMLAVDGGIDNLTAIDCIKAGADTLISGSFIFNGDYKNNISQLRGQP